MIGIELQVSVPVPVSWTSGRLSQAAFRVSARRTSAGVRWPCREQPLSVVPLDECADRAARLVQRLKVVEMEALCTRPGFLDKWLA